MLVNDIYVKAKGRRIKLDIKEDINAIEAARINQYFLCVQGWISDLYEFDPIEEAKRLNISRHFLEVE